MKRLDELKKEKEHLARQVEMEEENITNKLSKKLEKVKQEKVTLENLLEQEQEYIVNKLQKQVAIAAPSHPHAAPPLLCRCYATSAPPARRPLTLSLPSPPRPVPTPAAASAAVVCSP